jgi:hypothetical protein
MKNKMTDLRNHLFETLEALKDKDQPMEIERAKAVSHVAQVLINSAKVEIQFLEAINSEDTSEFFGSERLESRADRPNLRLANGAR